MYKTTLSIITAMALSMSVASATESKDVNITTPKVEVMMKKDIHVVATTPVVVAEENYNDTIISTKGVKNHYGIGEPIEVKLNLKREAYIYFWTISYDGKGYLILPNDFDIAKKYTPNKEHIIPEASAKYIFASDRAGVEELFVLATDKMISPNKIKKIFDKMSAGVVPTASKESIKHFLSKDLMVIAKEEKLRYDIESFLVAIHPTKEVAQSRNNPLPTQQTTINITIKDK